MGHISKDTNHIKPSMYALINTKARYMLLGTITFTFVLVSTSCGGSSPGEKIPPGYPTTPIVQQAADNSFDSSQDLLADALMFLEEEKNEAQIDEYTIEKAEFNDEHFNIKYPQIKNSISLGAEVISKINNQIFDYSCNWIEVEEEEKQHVSITTEYKIMMANANILSVYFFGYLENKVHVTNFEFCMTYDMQTGIMKKLDDFLENDRVVAAIQSHNFFPVREDDIFWEDRSFYDYQNSFEQATQYTNNFFMSDNYIGIIVPVSRPMGDSLLLLCSANDL